MAEPVPPHVLIFPLPLQGPLNCTLKLAELLCFHGIHVTFLSTHHIHRRLLRHTGVLSRFTRFPHFRFETLPDGLPEDHPRSGDRFMELIDSMESATFPILTEMLTSGALNSKSETPVSCIIADGFFSFAFDVAHGVGIPLFYFETISPCGLWTYLCLPKLIESGELPFKGADLDEPITNVPAMEAFLRRRDLPSFYRTQNVDDRIIQLVLEEGKKLPLAQGIILNTFEDLEQPILTQIRTHCPNIYPIGPLHTLIKSRIPAGSISSNSLWEEDRSCVAWLDAQPPKSVVYVSIGSLAVMNNHQVLEFWHGLVNSGKRFLWVQRPGSISGETKEFQIPAEVATATKERGFIVRWAPQEEVLSHPAIGGFLTHSGWNSTLESIVVGVPMMCWPYFVDQQVNSRVVSEVWKVGVEMKDECKRGLIEKMVREVMEEKKDEFLKWAQHWAQLGSQSVTEGGTSSSTLDRLIQDITFVSTP